jgi:predicted HTH transcriptional regulator
MYQAAGLIGGQRLNDDVTAPNSIAGGGTGMNEQTIAEWLAAGEGERIEFKERYSSRVIESLVAMANTAGGRVLIGVDDRGRVVGLADPARVVDSVTSACRESVSPPLAPTITIAQLPEGAVVAAQIEATGRMHVKGGAVLLRHGRQTRRASSEEIRLLTLRETPEIYETLACSGATWGDLDEPALQKYFAARAPDALEQRGLALTALAIGQKFAVPRGTEVVPTVAGIVLFGSHPHWQQPNWRLTALRFSGLEITDPIVDRLDTEGAALRVIEQGESFLRRNLRMARLLMDKGTHFEEQDVPEYPLAAAHEAVANAVAHRDYAAPAQVFVRLYDDRLEIQNPGGLLPGVALEQVLAGGESRRRNPVIAEVLRQMGKMTTVGRGLVLIRQEMEALGSPPPVFESTTLHFRVTLPSRHRRL